MKARVATAFGLRGTVLEGIHVAGRIVDVVVDVNHDEWSRRRSANGNAVLDRDILRLLAQLPYREAVSLVDVDPFAEVLYRTLGDDLVRVTETQVERIWTPALDIRGFFVVSGNWRTALRRVSLFTADAPRAVAFTGSGSLNEARRRARDLGVGLARVDDEDIDVLVQPERHLVRHDEVRWALAETLFSQWKKQTVRA